MEIEEPLLGKDIDRDFQMEIWINNKKTQLIKNDETIKLGSDKLSLENVIGLITHKKKQNGAKIYHLYTYTRMKKVLRQEKRYLEHKTFEVLEPNNQEKLESSLIPQINNRQIGETTKILICFNPNAGSNSRNHLNSILEFLAYTNLTYEIFNTQYRNHCLEKLKQMKANKQESQYTAVAIVSGDGLMHEYVNAFSNIPVTHVPAGSGNAFAKTQMTQANQLCHDWQSIYLVIKNRKKKFNRIKYELQKQEAPVYSFLSLSWGMMSDVDINSEFLRCIGGLRFEVYAVWRLIKMRRYRGKLSFSTICSEMPPFTNDLANNPDYQIIDDTFLHTIFCTIPYISDKYKMAPLVSPEQKFIDMQVIMQETGRMQLIKYILNSESGAHFDQANHQPAEGFNFNYNQIKSFRLEPLNPNQMGILSIDGEAYEAQKIQGSFCEEQFEAFA